MNLFYEPYPTAVDAGGEKVAIYTDFRLYIEMIDKFLDEKATEREKVYHMLRLFQTMPQNMNAGIQALLDFAKMKELEVPSKQGGNAEVEKKSQKKVYSFRYDYPYILSAFLECYHIDLSDIDYMHWWKFRALFSGLPSDTEIKTRIHYRGLDASTIKDTKERKRILKIQREIMLPGEEMTDFEIGNAFI
jgi:hypothetical protein